jgi:hypothetical protein
VVWTASSNGWREMPLKTDLKGTIWCQLHRCGKEHAVCGVWEVFALEETLLTPTCFRSQRQIFAWGTKNSSCGHITPGLLGKDFGQDFSGFERDDLDEHVFLEFLPSGACFFSKHSQYIDLHPPVCHLFNPASVMPSMRVLCPVPGPDACPFFSPHSSTTWHSVETQ